MFMKPGLPHLKTAAACCRGERVALSAARTRVSNYHLLVDRQPTLLG
jgi:hypothetical protein